MQCGIQIFSYGTVYTIQFCNENEVRIRGTYACQYNVSLFT